MNHRLARPRPSAATPQASCYSNLGKHAEAAADCEEAIKATKFYLPAWRLLGKSRLALEEYDAAKAACEYALKLDDTDAESKACLDDVLKALGGAPAAETPVEAPRCAVAIVAHCLGTGNRVCCGMPFRPLTNRHSCARC